MAKNIGYARNTAALKIVGITSRSYKIPPRFMRLVVVDASLLGTTRYDGTGHSPRRIYKR
jgi:hypothetical protein